MADTNADAGKRVALSSAATINADGKVDHKEVQRIIELALNHEATGLKTTEKTTRAFRVLQERRRTVAPTDVNLAAAEHYLYMRSLAGTTGDPLSVAYPAVYELKKVYKLATGQEKSMRTTPSNPVLPPSIESPVWGTLGVSDGLKDYRGENPSQGMKVGSSLPAVAGEAYRANK